MKARYIYPRGKDPKHPWRDKRGQYIPIGFKLTDSDRWFRGKELYSLRKRREYLKKHIPRWEEEVISYKEWLTKISLMNLGNDEYLRDIESYYRLVQQELRSGKSELIWIRKRIKKLLYKPTIELMNDYYYYDYYTEEYYDKNYYLGITKSGRMIFIMNPNT